MKAPGNGAPAYVRSHVVTFTNHRWLADPKLDEIWRKQEAKTRGDIQSFPCRWWDFRLFKTIFHWEEEKIVAQDEESEQVATG